MNRYFGRAPENFGNVIDFYETPVAAGECLFGVENFRGTVWECASGGGSLSRVIEHHNKCISSDVRSGSSIYGEGGVDFLVQTKKVDNIITNPPFAIALEFIKKSKELARRKIAFFLRVQFLEGKSKYLMWTDKKFPLKKVAVFSRRVRFENPITGKRMGMVAYAWFIWDKDYKGKPYVDWIL